MQALAERTQIRQERYEAYQRWEQKKLSDPRLASVRILYEDMRVHGEILPQTWDRFDNEERTQVAESLQAKHTRIDRYRFDGKNIIITESDGVRPAYTLREVYQNGYERSKERAAQDSGFTFQERRDELFMETYQEVEAMMRGETDYDTVIAVSTVPEELLQTEEGRKALETLFYDTEEEKSFAYIFRRVSEGELEMSATTLYSSNLEAHAALLQSGNPEVPFAMLQSHEYGAHRLRLTTTEHPIEHIIAGVATQFDSKLEEITGQKHSYGRRDEREIDAHDLFNNYPEHWTAYKAYHEMLAKHLQGEELSPQLQDHLQHLLRGQEQVGKSVLDEAQFNKLKIQLGNARISIDMALGCKELLSYAHTAKMNELLASYRATGQFLQKIDGDRNMLDSYSSDTGSASTAAAARGDSYGGCEVGSGVSSLSTAANIAASQGITLEEALRRQKQEEKHCWELMVFGYTVRKNVTCPFCSQCVDARETAVYMECLSDDCGIKLNKETGDVIPPRRKAEMPEQPHEAQPIVSEEPQAAPRARAGDRMQLGSQSVTVARHIVLGAAETLLVTDDGDIIASGKAAEKMLATA